MNCREFEDQLDHLLDERREPQADPRLTAHARECDPCQQLLAGQRVLFTALKQAPLPPTSGSFARRVVQQAAPQVSVVHKGLSPQRAWWAIATLLASAAAVLIAVSLIWQARQGAEPQQGSAVVKNLELKNHRPNQRSAPPSGLALSQADWIVEVPRLPSRIRVGYRGTMDNLAIALPETVQRLDEVEHYAPGIRPIRITFGVMIDALWRTIPGTHNDDERPTRTSYRACDLRQMA